MIDVSFGSLFATDGFYKILTAAFVAGVVHGFSGFGSAMVFLPVAGQFLLPIFALTALTVMDASGPFQPFQSTSRWMQAGFATSGGCHDFGGSSASGF